jgi:adenylyltransferase/sulfurtransferase
VSLALVLGAGGLGCPALLGLAGSGVAVRLVDDDVVDATNLQRQLLYRPSDVGRPKVEAAAERLAELGFLVEPVRARFTAASAAALLRGADVVLDGTDNFATRFLASDAAVLLGVPLVHGGATGFSGQVMTVVGGKGACYRCLFEAPPDPGAAPACSEAGVLGAACGAVGSLMAERALRALAGAPLVDELTILDLARGQARSVRLRRDPRCAVCGDAPTIRALEPARYEVAA